MRLSLLFLLLMIGVGSMAQQMNTIDKEELPSDLLTHISEEYAGYEVIRVEEEVNSGSTRAFWIDVQKKKKVLTLEYGPNGNLLSRSKSKSYIFDTNKPKDPSKGGDPMPPPMPNL